MYTEVRRIACKQRAHWLYFVRISPCVGGVHPGTRANVAGSTGAGYDSTVWSLAGLWEDVLSIDAYTRLFPVTLRPEILVCGGGPAGIGGAVAGARSGADTLLVERMGFSGGFFTAVIGSTFDGLIDTRSGRPVVGGIVFEMLERMGVLCGRDPRISCFAYNGEISQVAEHPDWITPTTEPERFKKAADERKMGRTVPDMDIAVVQAQIVEQGGILEVPRVAAAV